MAAQVDAGFYTSFQNMHGFYYIKLLLLLFTVVIQLKLFDRKKKPDTSNVDAKADEKKYRKQSNFPIEGKSICTSMHALSD